MTSYVTIVLLALAAKWFLDSDKRTVKSALKKGFPKKWETLLITEIYFYSSLSPEMKERFKTRVHHFILSTPIRGYQEELSDKIKLMVASSAVVLTLSFDQWDFSSFGSVLVTDEPLNDDTQNGTTLGMVRTYGSQSNMILSKRSLIYGFENYKDKKNVSIHEFAHVLDHADGDIDGIPKALMPPEFVESWKQLMEDEIARIKKGDSDINPYGATNEAEFFAVISEYFFEKPDRLKQQHPKIFAHLEKTFKPTFFKRLKNKITQVKAKIGRNSKCPCGSGIKFKKCCLK